MRRTKEDFKTMLEEMKEGLRAQERMIQNRRVGRDERKIKRTDREMGGKSARGDAKRPKEIGKKDGGMEKGKWQNRESGRYWDRGRE